MRYRIICDVRHGYYVTADSMEEAAAEAARIIDAEYPGISFRIELEDE